jgi:hypothetical protein
MDINDISRRGGGRLNYHIFGIAIPCYLADKHYVSLTILKYNAYGKHAVCKKVSIPSQQR